jgi:hypothetical protein
MSQGGIPPFGTLNGVTPKPTTGEIDPAIATTFAMMYNYYDPNLLTDNSIDLNNTSSAIINLDPYTDSSNNDNDDAMTKSFDQRNFLNLFYTTNAGYFNVNPSNIHNPAVRINGQRFKSSNSANGQSNIFSLYQNILKAYCNQKGINVNDINTRTIMLLQKECFAYQSLASVKGSCISLAWDELIGNLTTSGIMVPADEDDVAIIPLNLILKFHSFVLNFDMDIVFTYLVPIEGYLLPSDPSALSSDAPINDDLI